MGKRFPIKLPYWHEKRLIWWASCKGTSKTGLGQNIIQARVEANAELIERMLADRAEGQGIPIEELKQQILEENGFVGEEDPDDE